MRLVLMLFIPFLSILLQSCRQKSFPDEISNIKSDTLKRINGTKVFMIPNNSFKQLLTSSILLKDSSCFLQVFENEGSSFDESYYSNFNDLPETIIYKKIKFNGFNGIYAEGNLEGKTLINVFFGDSTFVTIIQSRCLKEDNISRNEIIDILSTAYYDKALKFNPFELANFTLDTSITSFHFTEFNHHNGFQYWPDKPKYNFSHFSVEPLFSLSVAEEEKQILQREFSIAYEMIAQEKVLINNYRAYINHLKSKDEDDDEEIYDVTLMNGNIGVRFSGFFQDEKFLYKFKETIKSIRLIDRK